MNIKELTTYLLYFALGNMAIILFGAILDKIAYFSLGMLTASLIVMLVLNIYFENDGQDDKDAVE